MCAPRRDRLTARRSSETESFIVRGSDVTADALSRVLFRHSTIACPQLRETLEWQQPRRDIGRVALTRDGSSDRQISRSPSTLP